PVVAGNVMTITQNEIGSRPGEVELRGSSSAPEPDALMIDESLSARARLQMREAMSPIASLVDFAESAETALKLINAYAYSVIFVDARLPDEDAYEMCGRIKKHPLQQRASMVMLTGHSSP